VEAGSSASYLSGSIRPDYRGGISYLRALGRPLGGERGGWFADAAFDGVFVSRFGDDVLFYLQNRAGYTPELGRLKLQVYMNANATQDSKRQYWANTVEAGPGVRFRWAPLPESLVFTVNFVRGSYTRNQGNPRPPNYFDLRAGFSYAFTY
jgi:hypothetical protein